MVGQIVVVFDRLQGGGFAEETEVVDGDGGRKKGLESWEGSINKEVRNGEGRRATYRRPCRARSGG